jgi:hypothetical protein
VHIIADKGGIAIVETRTIDKTGNDPASSQLISYQCGNNLGSVNIEVNDKAHIISY